MGRKLLRNLDKLAGGPVVSLLATWDSILKALTPRDGSSTIAQRAPHNILVVKLVGLGDTALMLTPLAEVRRRFPDARITALVTPLSSGILRGQPAVDDLIVFDALAGPASLRKLPGLVRSLKTRRFDWVLDFEQYFLLTSVLSYLTGAGRRIGFRYGGSPRGRLLTDPVLYDPSLHMIDNFMRLLGPLGVTAGKVDTLVAIRVSRDDEARVSAWLEAERIGGDDVLVGLHAGSGPRAPHRRWDKARFAEIARRIIGDRGAEVILTGTAGEQGLIREIVALVGSGHVHDAGGKFQPRELAALAGRCRLFVSNDTGAMHIAAAAGVPTIGLFGPNSPGNYSPVGLGNASLYGQLPCSPCVEIHKGKVRECRRAVCMDGISVEDVWSEILRHDLGRRGP